MYLLFFFFGCEAQRNVGIVCLGKPLRRVCCDSRCLTLWPEGYDDMRLFGYHCLGMILRNKIFHCMYLVENKLTVRCYFRAE